MFISPARRRWVEHSPMYCLFGEHRSRSALQGYKGSTKLIKILFLQCNDLRNVLETIANKPNRDECMLTIHLNHPCIISCARNILIFKIIFAPTFDVSNPQDIDYLWDLWYNLHWKEPTRTRFVNDVENLIDELPPYCFSLTKSQLDNVKGVWISWLSTSKLNLTAIESKKEKILKERFDFIADVGLNDLCIAARACGNINETHKQLAALADSREEAMNITKDFPEQLKTKLSRETKEYFETGNCDSSKKIRSALFNPTLLEPGTLRWRVDPYSCPFDSYLPLQLDQLEVSAEEGIITRYCMKKLKKLVSVYIENRNNFNLNFHLKDALQFCIEETSEKFDVIDCSSLADEVGMANLILSSKNVLELQPEAVLLTESHHWRKLASTVALYLEDCLCAPLSMIPTIYGLRLAYPVELGSPILLQIDRIIGYEFPPVTLTWHRTLRSKNLPVSYSPVLERCLKKLEEKCYFMDCGSDWLVEKRGPVSYTPLTFDFMATGLAEYVATHGPLPQMKPFELYPLPRFFLARKTLEDWRNRQSVVLLTASEQFSPLFGKFFSKKFIYGSPLLRMVLVPNNASLIHFAALFDCENLTDDLPINWADRMPDVHYFDNFHLRYVKDQIGSSRSLKVSFLLPRKHELGTHCGIIIDMISGIPLIFLGSLQDMHQETFDRLFPIKMRTSSLSEVFPQSPTLHVVNCKEDETSFAVQINIGTEFFKGIRISTDKQFPCESGHKVTFSLDQPEGTEPLTLHFPHPILSEEINGSLHRSEHSIQAIVKKGLNEPWPCQFVETPKWNVEQFSPWSELSASPSAPIESQLLIHCIAQQGNNPFNAAWREILAPSKCAKLLPIQVVRNLIGNSLYYAEKGHEIFVVNNIQDPQKPLWHFLVHRPILVSPSNTPVLLISAVDHRLSHKLISKGNLEASQTQKDFQRIVGHRVTASVKPIELNATEEASQLLRFVLRLNSTRMIPTSWQGENLPLGKYSPYLATFLSPLYLDYPYPDMGRECVQSLKNWQRMYYRVRTVVQNVNRDLRPS